MHGESWPLFHAGFSLIVISCWVILALVMQGDVQLAGVCAWREEGKKGWEKLPKKQRRKTDVSKFCSCIGPLCDQMNKSSVLSTFAVRKGNGGWPSS